MEQKDWIELRENTKREIKKFEDALEVNKLILEKLEWRIKQKP
jgi:hypothetical protein